MGKHRAGASVILISPSRTKLRYAARLGFSAESAKCSNNIAEYEAVLLGLQKLRALGVRNCILNTDCKIVASQIEKECIARDPTLERYLDQVRRMETFFKGFTVEFIERSKNSKADELAKAAAKNTCIPPDVFFQIMKDPSIKTIDQEPKMIHPIESLDWRSVIAGN